VHVDQVERRPREEQQTGSPAASGEIRRAITRTPARTAVATRAASQSSIEVLPSSEPPPAGSAAACPGGAGSLSSRKYPHAPAKNMTAAMMTARAVP
jgi:hypothetical protein